jgi:4-amino-4-deoxy-L-arabinose transferase-like glycosyltransferase
MSGRGQEPGGGSIADVRDGRSQERPRRWLLACYLVALVVAVLIMISGLSIDHRSWLGGISLWLAVGTLVLLGLGVALEIRRSRRQR